MKGSSGLSAGLVLVLIDIVCIGGGYIVGSRASGISTMAGVIGGAAVGFPLSFVVVWMTYMRPLRDESLTHDYSHLPTSTDWNEE